jgi:hypothetical protein
MEALVLVKIGFSSFRDSDLHRGFGGGEYFAKVVFIP